MLHPDDRTLRLWATLLTVALLSAGAAWKAFDEPRLAAAILVCGAVAIFASAIWRALR